MLLEIAVFNYPSALIAADAGADRIELCDNAAEGGTTPGYGVLQTVREEISLPVFPIIRPRGGDFLYSDGEFEVMKKDVAICRELGFEGIVTGILLADGSPDKRRCGILRELAYPMEVTFHRAFDRCKDPFQSLEHIIELGFQRILTSGQSPLAIDNLPLIASLIIQAADRIIVMPGSGVRSANVDLILQTGATELHSSARSTTPSPMLYFNDKLKEEDSVISVDQNEIRRMKQILNANDG